MRKRTDVKTWVVISIFLVALGAAGTAAGQIMYVDTDGPADFNNIQAAINASIDGDIIVVSPGTYTGPGNRDIDYLGKSITVRSTNPYDPGVVAATVIDCNGTKTENHRAFTFHNGEGPSSVVRGLTIINGCAYDGGGILCLNASPTIRDCIVTKNTGYGGGAIYCDDYSDTTIANCIIFLNDCDGIYCDDNSDVVISGCVIEDNEDSGINCNWRSRSVITDCYISNNNGGVKLDRSKAIIEKCIITANAGSGVECYDCYPKISDCWIVGNTGWNGGGINSHNDAGPLVQNCVIANNLARNDGGGIHCRDESEPKIVNCVIMNNEAFGYGGGIYSFDETEPIITNSILWGNSAKVGSEIALYSNSGRDTPGNMAISYSNVQGGQEGVFVDIDCVLNWGVGMTDAEPGFAFEGDYHLAIDSPCIDAGTNNPLPYDGLPDLDLDGNLRPLDGDGDGDPIADIGVYEFNPQQPTIALSVESLEFFTQENGPDPNDQILSIRNAGGNTLSWEIVEGCRWLEAIPTTGTSSGDINDVVLEVKATGLTHGDYVCELQVVDQQAVNNPRTVLVTLHVNARLHVPLEYDTIQAAINNAVDHDVVLVADGIYTGDGNKDLDFHGKNIIVRSENGPNDCIIDCEGQGRGFYLHSWETSPAAIEGFTIINGCPDTVGGGIRCTGYSGPTIENCVIKDCTSTAPYSYGNGIFCGYGTKIESCTIQGNKGGIAAAYGATIRNCIVTDNYDAPGIVCAGGRPTIEDCTINGNQGGGMTLLHHNEAIIDNCVIMGNVVREEHRDFALGAGINCFTGSSPTISNTVISGNFTEFGGGGICCNMGSNAKIINCTIAGNRASLCGGGLWSFSFCSPVVTNSILWGNTAEVGSQIAQEHPDYPGSGDTILSVTHSDVEGGQGDVYVDPSCTLVWHPGNIGADPCFVQPGYWDGNGVWVDGDYHLMEDSPCIDAGDPNYVAEPNETDLDGRPRVIGGRIDMGAYESPVLAEVDIDPDTLNLASKGKWLTCYIWLPEEYNVADIDPNTVFLDGTVGAEHIRADEEQQVATARFSRSEVQGILDVGEIELIISGQLTDGTVFEATDAIRVIDKAVKK